MSCNDQSESTEVNVTSLINDPINIQSEKIADNFASISNEYEPLKYEDFDINSAKNKSQVPWITPNRINKKSLQLLGISHGKLLKSFPSIYLSLFKISLTDLSLMESILTSGS